MKTRRRDTGTTTGLPPPPAPPSRDANPWTIPGPDAPRAPARPAGATASPSPKRFPGGPSARPGPRRMPVFALLVLGVIAFVALGGAVHEIGSGNYADAVGPLLAVAFAAFVVWKQARGRRW
jgi:hypothetical protein